MTPTEKAEIKEIVDLANEMTRGGAERSLGVTFESSSSGEWCVINHPYSNHTYRLQIRTVDGHYVIPGDFGSSSLSACVLFAIARLRGVILMSVPGGRGTRFASLRGTGRTPHGGSVKSALQLINMLSVWPEEAAMAYLTYFNKIPDTFVTADQIDLFQCLHLRVCVGGKELEPLFIYRDGAKQRKGESAAPYPMSVLDFP